MEDKIRQFLAVDYGSGSGYGDGYGDGYGSGSGYGDGYGDGSGDGVDYYEGQRIYFIDGVQTLIDSVHRNIAKGRILRTDFTTKDCFIVKVDGRYFAHGETSESALRDAMEKSFKDSPLVETRIAKFVEQYPTLQTIANNSDLFVWHNRLTGSCEMGRRSFASERDIDIDNGKMTIQEFIDLTKESYGGESIKQLYTMYL